LLELVGSELYVLMNEPHIFSALGNLSIL